MYLPDYQTIKFEHQERIDKAARQRDAFAVRSPRTKARRAAWQVSRRRIRRGWLLLNRPLRIRLRRRATA